MSEMQIDVLEAGVDKENNDAMRRYALAVVAAIIALWLRRQLSPLLGENNPYHTAWAAVVFSAWYCGVGPSIVTALLSVLGSGIGSCRPLIPFGLRTLRLQFLEWLGSWSSPV